MASEFVQGIVDLFVLLAAAQLVGYAFKRLQQPTVIGEVVAGVLVGPAVLGLAHESELLSFTAELGAIFLLLLVGVETRLRDILVVGKEALLVALIGVFAPFFAGYGFGVFMGFATIPSLFLGTALVATSVGITARVLQELGALSRLYSRIILGAAVIDDVLGLIVLAVVSGMAAAGSIEVFAVAKLIAFSLAFVAGATLMVPVMRRLPIERLPFRTPLGFALVLGLGMAAASAVIGLAPIVGAFFAGMLLAEKKEEHDVEEAIHGISSLVTPVFFAVVGLRLDLLALMDPFVLAAGGALTVIAVLGKLIGGIGALSQGVREAAIVGMGMVPRGEVGLIVAAIGLSAGAVDPTEYAIVLFVVVVTTLLAPLLLRPMIQAVEAENSKGPPPEATPDLPSGPTEEIR